MPRKPKNISKKRKFVKQGIFYSELNSFLAKELYKDGYGGCEVRVKPQKTEIIISATKTPDVQGQDGKRLREIKALIYKRFKFNNPDSLEVFVKDVRNKGLSALSQAEAVRYRLMEGLSVRRAAYSVLKFISERGAKGCEVMVTGKVRGQRAKAMKFRDGYMIAAGDATNYYLDYAVRHVHLRQGVIGIKVTIMLPHDPEGKVGPSKNLPDAVQIKEPKEEIPDFNDHRQRAEQPQRDVRQEQGPPQDNPYYDNNEQAPQDMPAMDMAQQQQQAPMEQPVEQGYGFDAQPPQQNFNDAPADQFQQAPAQQFNDFQNAPPQYQDGGYGDFRNNQGAYQPQ